MWISRQKWEQLNERIKRLEEAIPIPSYHANGGFSFDYRIGMVVGKLLDKLNLQLVDTCATNSLEEKEKLQ